MVTVSWNDRGFNLFIRQLFQIGQLHAFTKVHYSLWSNPLNTHCTFVNLYGPNDAVERATLWAELINLKNNSFTLWCIAGDFNIFKTSKEKSKGNLDVQGMETFASFINDMSLMDLPMVGGLFTWSNNRNPYINYRLDRFLVSSELFLLCPSIIQKCHPRSLSNHNLVSLETNKES